MKAKIFVPLIIIAIVFLIKISVVNDKIEKYEIVYEQIEQVDHKVYYYDNQKLVYVSCLFDGKIQIDYLFDLLTNKSNSIKESYDTSLVISTQVLDYEIDNQDIYLNLDEEFSRYNEESSYQIYSQIKHTFSNLGYGKIFIKIEGNLLLSIGHIDISNGIILQNI